MPHRALRLRGIAAKAKPSRRLNRVGGFQDRTYRNKHLRGDALGREIAEPD